MAANPSTPPRNSESVIGAEHGAPSGALLVDHSGSASIGKGKKRKETHSKSIKVKLMKAPSTAIPDSSNWDSVAEEVRKRLSNGSDFQQPNVAEEANEPKTNLFKTKMRGTRKGGKDKSPTETKSDLTDTLRICFLTASPSPPLVSDSIHLPSAAGEGAHKGAKALDLQRRSTFTGEDEAQEAEKYWDGVFAVKGEFMHLNYECEDKPQEFSVTDIEVIHRWSTWLAETMRVADILGLSLSAGPGLPALALMKADGTIDLNGMKSALRVGKGVCFENMVPGNPDAEALREAVQEGTPEDDILLYAKSYARVLFHAQGDPPPPVNSPSLRIQLGDRAGAPWRWNSYCPA